MADSAARKQAPDPAPIYRTAPHNIEAEQALIALLAPNGTHDYHEALALREAIIGILQVPAVIDHGIAAIGDPGFADAGQAGADVDLDLRIGIGA